MWLGANGGAAVVRPFSPLHSGRQKDSCVYNHPFTALGVGHAARCVFGKSVHVCIFVSLYVYNIVIVLVCVL